MAKYLLRNLALIFVPAVVVVGGIIWYVAYNTRLQVEDELVDKLADHVDALEDHIEDFLITRMPTVVDMATQKETVAFFENPEDLKDEVEYRFNHLAGIDMEVQQLRLLSTDGHELLRVNAIDGVTTVTPPQLLQDKSDRTYFKQLSRSSSNMVYISAMELNEEKVDTDKYMAPVVRLGRKVVDERGAEQGIFIMNLELYPLFERLQKIMELEWADVFLADAEGRVLIEEVDGNFSLIGSDSVIPTLEEVMPEMWKQLGEDKAGTIDINGTIYVYVKVTPWDYELDNSGVIPLFNKHLGVLVGRIPDARLDRLSLQQFNPYMYLIPSILLALFLTFYKSKNDLKEASVANELKTLNDTLEKRVEERTRELEDAQLEMTQQIEGLNASAIVSTTDAKGDITFVNELFCKISGYTVDELLGQNHRILKSGKQPDGLFVGMWKAISGGRIWHGELINRNKEGQYYWLDATIIPFKNSNGEIIKYLSITFDITEVRLHSEQLEKANSELEAFSYSVSHDLRAPLRAIDGFSNMLGNKYGDQLDETGLRYLNTISTNAKKMGRLIDDILAFSRLGRQEMSLMQFDLRDLMLEEYEYLTASGEYPNAVIKMGELSFVLADRNLLKQVAHNLLSNALKYSSKKENPVIEVGQTEKDGQRVFYVKDNGAGFDMKYYDKLFGVFQRLHRENEFEGNGVGLALIKRIVNRHRGNVWAEGKLDEGATFYFTLNENQNPPRS